MLKDQLSSKEATLQAFIASSCGKELDYLLHLGGSGLRNLAVTLYTDFGLYPGRDHELADYLATRLPLKIVDGFPTFVYEYDGADQPILAPWDGIDGEAVIVGAMYAGGAQAYDVFLARTPLTDALVDGAEKLHKGVQIEVARPYLELHLGVACYNTAKQLGLNW